MVQLHGLGIRAKGAVGVQIHGLGWIMCMVQGAKSIVGDQFQSLAGNRDVVQVCGPDGTRSISWESGP